MSHITRAGRSARKTTADAATRGTEGRRGAALAPPTSGIDFVDRTASAPAVMQAQRPHTGAPGGDGLPPPLRDGIESLSGMAMDHVRVHYDSSLPAQLDALAYAKGADIHLAPGQDRHLPHEAWHVVQQAQKRVRPTVQAQGGAAINDDPALEREADRMGARALRASGDQAAALAPVRPATAADAPAQRMTARIRRQEKREPNAQEITAARQAGIVNSQRLAGHGRARHGRNVEVPSDVQAQQAQADRQNAIDEAIQLQPDAAAHPPSPVPAPASGAGAVVQCWPPFLDRLLERRSGFAPVADPDQALVSEAKVAGHRAETATATVEARRRDKVAEGLTQVGEEGLKMGLDALGGSTIGVPLGTIVGAARSALGVATAGHEAHRQTGSSNSSGEAVGRTMMMEGVGEALGNIPVIGEFIGMVEGIATAAHAVIQSESSRVEEKQAALDEAIKDRPVIDEARDRLAQGDLEPAAKRRLEKAIKRYDALVAKGSQWQQGKARKGKMPLLSQEIDD